MQELVFVVDDHEDSAELLSIYLKAHGYDVRTFATFELALNACREHSPCIVLMDLAIPAGMTPQRFAMQVRKINPNVKILVLSALNDCPKIAAEIGAVGWIRKPYEVEQVQKVASLYCSR
jgi:CheY-like chemotaxis protein